MKKSDFRLFSTEETRELDDTFYVEALPIRRRYVIYGTLLIVAFVVALYVWGASRGVLAAAFAAYVLLATVEKVSYIRNLNIARGVVQKLVRRVEQLEGVPTTPDNAPPNRTTHPNRTTKTPV